MKMKMQMKRFFNGFERSNNNKVYNVRVVEFCEKRNNIEMAGFN